MGRVFTIVGIGNYAFSGCSSLASVHIPDGVKEIGYSAFNRCSSLASVHIPDGVTKIGNMAFSECSSLISVTIPASVTKINQFAFSSCSSLTSVTILDGETNERITLGDNIFNRCYNLISVTLPSRGAYMEYQAFRDCKSLTSIIIPQNSGTGYGLFEGCTKLDTIIINSGVGNGKYDYEVFKKCPSGYIHISSNVNNIGNYVFDTENSEMKEIIIDDSDQTLKLGYTSGIWDSYSTYYGCFYSKKLEKIYLGRNLSYEGNNQYKSFPYDATETYIGDYVTSLDGLKLGLRCETLTIGKGLQEVPDLSNCSSLASLTLTSTVPQKAVGFSNGQYMTLKVYVPKGSLAAYQSADVWKNFWNLQESETTDIDNAIMNTQTAKELKRYDAAGRETDSHHKGLNIIRMSDGTTKKVIVK